MSTRTAGFSAGRFASAAEVTDLLASLPEQPLHAAVIAAGDRELQGTWGPAQPYTAADAFEVVEKLNQLLKT